jgi:hypothetical protein
MTVGVHVSEIDPGYKPASQMRMALDREAIEQYAERLASMPPVKLMYDATSGTHWVVDGAHTISAAVQAGRNEVWAEVTQGTYEEAWRKAAQSNETHGVRRTTGDRHAALLRACEQWPGKPYDWYADLCNVARDTAWRVLRNERSAQLSDSESCPKIEGKDGKARPAVYQPRQPADEIDGEEQGEQPEQEDFRGIRAETTRPRCGMDLARVAVWKLEEIPPDDLERERAFNFVRSWIDEHA